MSWETKSDFEINKAVAEIVGHEPSETAILVEKTREAFAKSEDPTLRMAVKGLACDDYFGFNPCNNPSDAWPLIQQNGITINRDTCQCHVSSYFSNNIMVSLPNSKALRAAMIVLLKMKGVACE